MDENKLRDAFLEAIAPAIKVIDEGRDHGILIQFSIDPHPETGKCRVSMLRFLKDVLPK